MHKAVKNVILNALPCKTCNDYLPVKQSKFIIQNALNLFELNFRISDKERIHFEPPPPPPPFIFAIEKCFCR